MFEDAYWLNLLDWLPPSNATWFSTDNLTSSPHEPSTLFAALGAGLLQEKVQIYLSLQIMVQRGIECILPMIH